MMCPGFIYLRHEIGSSSKIEVFKKLPSIVLVAAKLKCRITSERGWGSTPRRFEIINRGYLKESFWSCQLAMNRNSVGEM